MNLWSTYLHYGLGFKDAKEKYFVAASWIRSVNSTMFYDLLSYADVHTHTSWGLVHGKYGFFLSQEFLNKKKKKFACIAILFPHSYLY